MCLITCIEKLQVKKKLLIAVTGLYIYIYVYIHIYISFQTGYVLLRKAILKQVLVAMGIAYLVVRWH